MDFDVSDFNVRLRTIRIRELILTLLIGLKGNKWIENKLFKDF